MVAPSHRFCASASVADMAENFSTPSPKPLIIAHRGASGYRPEHSPAAYRLALELGAEAVEPDIVLSRDGVAVIRHDNELSETTNIADLAEFADRKTIKEFAGHRLEGWFVEDFTWEEISSLRSRERIPHLRPENTAFTDEPIWRLADLVAFLEGRVTPGGEAVQLVLEIKHASYYALLGFDLAEIVQRELQLGGWDPATTPLLIESFELPVLRQLGAVFPEATLIFLAEATGAPLDELLKAARTGSAPRSYAEFLSDEGLAELATVVHGVSVDKELILPRNDEGSASKLSDIVERIQRQGLLAVTWTLRPENDFLPGNYQDNWRAEWAAIMGTGVDAVFSDHPDLALGVRNQLH